MEFSAKTRRVNLHRTEPFDILIIGGGITGAGIARDAAMRGFRTALVEKGDFASGSSSKSTKLVHGGLRYLEMFEFGLVFEASRERKTLWTIAPHLTRPVPFLFPVYRDARWPAWMIDVGLWMYDAISLYRNYRNHRWLSNREITELMRGFDIKNINGGAQYYDGQVDDARLTLANIRAAHRYGAAVANYFEADALIREGDRVAGIRGHDVLRGEIHEIRAHVVVNATGIWCDSILQMDDPAVPRRMRPTKGIHILVPRRKIGGDSAVAFPNVTDGRLMFAVPWGDFQLIGTTDTDYRGNYDHVHADRTDVDYVIAAANHAFPGSPITAEDIVGAYSGLRPLVGEPGKSEEQTSREHEIWTSPSGLVSIAGGKLTTYRSMAEELVDLVEKHLRRDFSIRARHFCRTAKTPLIEEDDEMRAQSVAVEPLMKKMPPDVAGHLRDAYGPEYGLVLTKAAHDQRQMERIVDGLPYIWAEVPYAVEREMALCLTDIFERRLHLAMESRDSALAAAERAAGILGGCLGWDPGQIEAALGVYEARIREENQWRA